MDSGRAPSHLRYAFRSVFWAASSLLCVGVAQSVLEQSFGIPQRRLAWSIAAVFLVPLAHTAWVGRRTARDRWTDIGRSCAIGVLTGLILDGVTAIRGPEPLLAALGALQNAALATGAILLPRFALAALTPDIFAEEASIEGFRGQKMRQLLAHAFTGSLIVGMLVAIAVPNFMTFGLLAKSGEARVQIEAIRAAEERWYREHGEYLPTTPLPPGSPGVQRTSFDTEAHTLSGFERLGWPVEAGTQLYCRYAVAVGSGDSADAYTIEAVCDLDGDGEPIAFGWVRPAAGSRIGVPGPFGFCSVRGVLSRRGASDGQRLLDRYGPCDAMSAVSNF